MLHDPRRPLALLLPPVLFLAAGGVMLAWTWDTWADPLVDTGRELYVPWRLSEGEVLHRDLAWFNGPLSPYWNALLFRLFGVGLKTLVWADLALLAVAVALLFALVRRIAGIFAATVGGLVFLVGFAFGPLLPTSNFTWAFPYSHEMTHGLVLALAALWLLDRHRRSGRAAPLGLAGLSTGLCFLTKPEVFLAAALAVAAALLFARPPPSRLVLFLGAALAPPLVAWAALATALPAPGALRGVLGGWPYVPLQELREQFFYRFTLGTVPEGRSFGILWKWAAVEAAILAFGAGGALLLRRRSGGGRALAAAGGGLLALMALRLSELRWDYSLFPLPYLLIAFLVAAVVRWLCARDDPRAALRVALTVFALGLLPKVFLSVRVSQYGFGLALPGTLVALGALLHDIPAWIARRGGSGWFFRAVVLAALAAATDNFCEIYYRLLRHRTVTLGEGRDALRADHRAAPIRGMLTEIGKRLGPDQTLAVFPEGATLNYLARRRNPTPYLNFLPPELIMFGEERMVEAFRAQPPDYVILVNRVMEEYGVAHWGTEYGGQLLAWMQTSYVFVNRYDTPVPGQEGQRFIMELYQRK